MRSFLSLASIVVLILTVFFHCTNSNEDKSEIKEPENDGFIGDESCMSCHKAEYDLWKGSHHDWAMKEATEESVLGDFNNQVVTLDGVQYHFYKENSKFIIEVTEIDGNRTAYKIDYTFGVTPLQQYIATFGNGKRQVLRVSWDSINKTWFHQYADQLLHPNDWLHWTGGAQRWNTMCAECHSTNLKRNYDLEADSFNTTWSSINVSCESCHGPGSQHVEWAQGLKEKADKYILAGAQQNLQINQCAPCHSRRMRMTENMEVGRTFADQFLLQTISPQFYHPDGQIEDEDYVIGSFLQSKMYHNGVKCSDCHDPHSLELKMIGNELCMSCHEKKYNTPEHHFHTVNTQSAECVSCHMTGETYMGNDFRRDHSFRVPRPDQSIRFNTPNACTGCHTDKSDKWAAEAIENWYGPERPDHFSDALLLTSLENISREDQQEIREFIANKKAPAIARATAIENYSFSYSEQDLNTLLSILEDSSELVRYNGLMKFMNAPIENRLAISLKHLDDSTKIVRIAAARLIADVSKEHIPAEFTNDYTKAMKEYEEMLMSNSDFPMGRLNLGDYYFKKNQLNKAIKQYNIALEMDSLLAMVYPNLATAYNTIGKNNEALQTLNTLLKIEPEFGRGYYLRALLLYELGEETKAISDFRKAIDLNPDEFRNYYNLSTLHYQRKEYIQAKEVIEKGLEIYPDSPEGKQLLNLINQNLNQ